MRTTLHSLFLLLIIIASHIISAQVQPQKSLYGTIENDILIGDETIKNIFGFQGNDIMFGIKDGVNCYGGDGRDRLDLRTLNEGIRFDKFFGFVEIVGLNSKNNTYFFDVEEFILTEYKDNILTPPPTNPIRTTFNGGEDIDRITYYGEEDVIYDSNNSTVYNVNNGFSHNLLNIENVNFDFPITVFNFPDFTKNQKFGQFDSYRDGILYSESPSPAVFFLDREWSEINYATLGAKTDEIDNQYVSKIYGTNHGDIIHIGFANYLSEFHTGTGDDILYSVPASANAKAIYYQAGNDEFHLTEITRTIVLDESISLREVEVELLSSGGASVEAMLTIANHGTLLLDYEDRNDLSVKIILLSGGEIYLFPDWLADRSYSGENILIVGENGISDRIIGTWGDDLINYGEQESQVFYALGGNDVIEMSIGDNKIYGGEGFDVVKYNRLSSDLSINYNEDNISLTDIGSGLSDYIYCDVESIELIDKTIGIKDLQFNIIHKQNRGGDILSAYDNKLTSSMEFSVACDGEASFFELEGEGVGTLDIRLEDGEANEIGCLELLTTTNNRREFRYIHPTLNSLKGFPYNRITAYIYDEQEQRNVDQIDIKVYRPPILLLHGLWSNSDAFTALKQELINSKEYLPFQIMSPTYLNDVTFDQNFRAIRVSVDQLLDLTTKKKEISVKQVDIVAHSLGGILARKYLKEYTNSLNINKLITVNTPHSGSQLANLIMDPEVPREKFDFFCLANDFINGSCYNGALDDLKVDSRAIHDLNSEKEYHVPSHAICSELSYSGDNPLSILSEELQVVSNLLGLTAMSIMTLFNNSPNDGIVTLNSQIGGIATYSVFKDIDHTQMTNEMVVINRIRYLLDVMVSSEEFSNRGFDPEPETYINQVSENTPSSIREMTYTISDTLLTVGEDVIFHFDADIEVSSIKVYLQNEMGNALQRKDIIGNIGDATFVVNPYALGERRFIAFGYDTNKNLISSSKGIIYVEPKQCPNILRVADQFLAIGEERIIQIEGVFDDYQAEMSGLNNLSFEISDESIVEFIAPSSIKALNTGNAFITLIYKGCVRKTFEVNVSSNFYSCLPSIYHNVGSVKADVYIADEILSVGTIAKDTIASYMAGSSVVLNPEFNVQSGGIICVDVGVCPEN